VSASSNCSSSKIGKGKPKGVRIISKESFLGLSGEKVSPWNTDIKVFREIKGCESWSTKLYKTVKKCKKV
jgi:hypothetical protein